MNLLFADIRYGLRMLVKSRQLTLVALTALALGIGANTAIFTVVNSVLLRPLPFRDAERLTLIAAVRAHETATTLPLSLPEFVGVPAVVILSASLWQRHFGSSPAAIGSTVRLDSQSFQVVGVMPPAFRFLN